MVRCNKRNSNPSVEAVKHLLCGAPFIFARHRCGAFVVLPDNPVHPAGERHGFIGAAPLDSPVFLERPAATAQARAVALPSDSIHEKSIALAKTNFQYEKRQKDLEKKRKKEEKLKKKADKASQPDGTQVEGDETPDNDTSDSATEDGVETLPKPNTGGGNQPI